MSMQRALAENRLLTAGLVITILGVCIQTAVHLLNAAFFHKHQLNANEEGNAFAWASVVATFGVAFAAAIPAVAVARDRARFATLAGITAFFSLDDMVGVHERLSLRASRAFDLPDVFDSVLFPAVYLPLLALASFLLIRFGREAPRRVRRFVYGGLALLALAVVAEALSAKWPPEDQPYHWGHILEGAFEEGAELGGWILIATAMTVLALRALAATGAAHANGGNGLHERRSGRNGEEDPHSRT